MNYATFTKRIKPSRKWAHKEYRALGSREGSGEARAEVGLSPSTELVSKTLSTLLRWEKKAALWIHAIRSAPPQSSHCWTLSVG